MVKGNGPTRTFSTDDASECREILSRVYTALKTSGYDPVGQIVGYLASDDPTYITNTNGARTSITKVQRYALMKELVRFYIDSLEREKHDADENK